MDSSLSVSVPSLCVLHPGAWVSHTANIPHTLCAPPSLSGCKCQLWQGQVEGTGQEGRCGEVADDKQTHSDPNQTPTHPHRHTDRHKDTHPPTHTHTQSHTRAVTHISATAAATQHRHTHLARRHKHMRTHAHNPPTPTTLTQFSVYLSHIQTGHPLPPQPWL